MDFTLVWVLLETKRKCMEVIALSEREILSHVVNPPPARRSLPPHALTGRDRPRVLFPLSSFPQLVFARHFLLPTPPPVAAPAVAPSQFQQLQYIASALFSAVTQHFRPPVFSQICRREADAVTDTDICGGAHHRKVARPAILASPTNCPPTLASLPQYPVHRQSTSRGSSRLKQNCHIDIRCPKLSPLFQTSSAARRGR